MYLSLGTVEVLSPRELVSSQLIPIQAGRFKGVIRKKYETVFILL